VGDTALIPTTTPFPLYTDRMKMSVPVANIYRVTKSETMLAFITQSSVSPTFNTLNFTLSGTVLDYSSLAVCFDQYRLKMVEFILSPRINLQGAQATTPVQGGFLYTVIDYDDSTMPTLISQALGYSTCIVTPYNQSVRRCFKPRIAVSAYNGSFTGYTNLADQWIDSASNNVAHFGVKVSLDTSPSASVQVFDAIIRTEWEFRSSK
jgi:hypothetical protein